MIIILPSYLPSCGAGESPAGGGPGPDPRRKLSFRRETAAAGEEEAGAAHARAEDSAPEMFPLDNITEEAAAGAEPAPATSSSLASGARVASLSTSSSGVSSQVRHLGQGGKLICSKMLCYFLLDGFVYNEIVTVDLPDLCCSPPRPRLLQARAGRGWRVAGAASPRPSRSRAQLRQLQLVQLGRGRGCWG